MATSEVRRCACICVCVWDMCPSDAGKEREGMERTGKERVEVEAASELPGNNSVCEISRMYFDSSRTSERFCVRVHAANTNTSQCARLLCGVGALLSFVSFSSFSARARPVSLSPSCRGNMTIIRYEATSPQNIT